MHTGICRGYPSIRLGEMRSLATAALSEIFAYGWISSLIYQTARHVVDCNNSSTLSNVGEARIYDGGDVGLVSYLPMVIDFFCYAAA